MSTATEEAQFTFTKEEIEQLKADALTEYKNHVRETVLAAQEEQDWCNDGTNEYLEKLGLEKIKVPTRYRAEVVAKQTLYHYFEGYTEEEARAKAEASLNGNELRFWSRTGNPGKPGEITITKAGEPDF